MSVASVTMAPTPISLRQEAAHIRERAAAYREQANDVSTGSPWDVFMRIVYSVCDTENYLRRQATRLDLEAARLENQANAIIDIPDHIFTVLGNDAITHRPLGEARNIELRRALRWRLGLSLEQALQMNTYIQTNKVALQTRVPQDGDTVRIEKESSGLPRTLHLINDHGTLRVMVLLKRKGVQALGGGAFKSVTVAVDWIDGSSWAYSVAKGHATLDMRNEWDMEHLAAAGTCALSPLQTRVLRPAPIGMISYVHGSRNIRKRGFFTRMADGSLRDLFRGRLTLTREQRVQAARDLIDTFYILQERGIAHRDIKPNNILYVRRGDRIQFYLIDYGLATPAISSEYDLAGTRYYGTPEMTRYWGFVDARLGTTGALQSLMAHTRMREDIWGLAHMLWLLLNPGSVPVPPPRAAMLAAEARACSDRRAYYLSGDFYAQTFGQARSPVPEPRRGTRLHAVWQAFQYNPDHRISITELRDRFAQATT